eukprot:scaffold4142_cov37-Prasinocladus_malaysianus.AAC.1
MAATAAGNTTDPVNRVLAAIRCHSPDLQRLGGTSGQPAERSTGHDVMHMQVCSSDSKTALRHNAAINHR